MIRRRGRGVAVAMIILLVASACSGGGGGSAAKNNSSTSSSTTDSSSSSTDSDSVGAGKSQFGPNDDDAIIEKAVDDVQSFYEKIFPQLYGGQFAPVSGGLFPVRAGQSSAEVRWRRQERLRRSRPERLLLP